MSLLTTPVIIKKYSRSQPLQGDQDQPAFFSTDATVPSVIESPIEGTTTLASSEAAADT